MPVNNKDNQLPIVSTIIDVPHSTVCPPFCRNSWDLTELWQYYAFSDSFTKYNKQVWEMFDSTEMQSVASFPNICEALQDIWPCEKNVFVWFFWLFSDCNFDSLSFQLLGDLDKWGVDMFKIAEYSNNRPLTCVTYKIFQVKISCLYFSSITKTCSINEQCKLWKQNSLIYHVLWTNAK